MRFLADRMLGKLAKKLRLLGFDTLYLRDATEEEIIERALKEDRILLTRDRDLIKKALKSGLNVYGLKADKWRSQVQAVLKRFQIKPEDLDPFSRCMECNVELTRVEKSSVEKIVPEYVFRTQEAFYICPECGRVYWAGTHVERMKELLNEFGITFDERNES